jgi:glucokinase
MAIIALDLGGTKLAAMLADSQGRVISKNSVLLDGRTGRKVGALITETISDLTQFATKKRLTIEAIGICVPGIVHRKQKTVWAPNIPGWKNYALEKEIRQSLKLRIPIRIESDRTCYILGEHWRGAAQGCTDAIFLAVGTGIGAGIMSDGRVIRGQHDIAGAIGWTALQPAWQRKFKSCGCFEYYASGDGLARIAQELGWHANAHEIFTAYGTGSTIAKKVIDQAITFWGMAVANLVSLFNPQKIIFGGGVFGPATKFLPRIYTEATKWAQPISIRQVKLVKSKLGADAGLFGAAQLALNPNEQL